MWTAEGREQCGPEPFDHGYRRERLGECIEPKREENADQLMKLVGDPRGLRVLDLGGGLTLVDRMHSAASYTVVDFSPACCELARRRPNVTACENDAAEWLNLNRERFDVTVAFALLAYLPFSFAELLFEVAPSPILCVAEARGQGYLQYDTRITAFCEQDFLDLAKRHGWSITRDFRHTDHIHMRFERHES